MHDLRSTMLVSLLLTTSCCGHADHCERKTPKSDGVQSAHTQLRAGDLRLLPSGGQSSWSGHDVQLVLDRRAAQTEDGADRSKWISQVDGAGRFSFDLPAEHGFLSLWIRHEGRWRLIVGGLYQGEGIDWFGGRVDLTVPPLDSWIRVKIEDTQGRPVRGWIRLVPSFEAAPVDPGMAVQASESGIVSLGPIERDYLMDVGAAGFATTRVGAHQWPAESHDSIQTVALMRSTALSVTVLPEASSSGGRLIRFGYRDVPNGGGVGWFQRVHPDKSVVLDVPADGPVDLEVLDGDAAPPLVAVTVLDRTPVVLTIPSRQ